MEPILTQARRFIGSAGDVHAEAIYLDLLRPTAPAHELLGLDALRRGQLEDALTSLRTAVYLRPDVPNFHASLSRGLLATGHADDAAAAADRAVLLDDTHAASFDAVGAVAFAVGRANDAERAFRRAVELSPDSASRRANLGVVLMSVGRLVEATALLRRAVELDPASERAAEMLVSCLSELGEFREAEAARRAAPAGSSFSPLFALADPTLSPAEVAHVYRRRAAELGVPSVVPLENDRDPCRRLRVGYLSADLRAHSTTCFLMPVLRHHDRASFEVFAYASNSTSDSVTGEIRSLVDRFHVVVGLRDDELEAQIRADGIDVLIDPSGFTSDHRLAVFARKPAPVTVAMLGHPAVVDAYLTDAFVDPPGMTDALVPQELVRLPRSFQCFDPPKAAPPVAEPPALANGFITFGSFNGYYKMNDGVLAAWAAVLRRVPASRLYVKCKAMAEAASRASLEARFASLGVERERLTLVPHERSRKSHLALYGEVDVCLDTFPYNGTTTTCEALWMGVPVVTVAGRSHIARTGVSVLTNAGLPELVAPDVDAFVEIAAALASDVPRLLALRLGMRDRLLASPLLDARVYTADFEAALRGLWRRWCERS
jgi:predicted O-linked N-acetylglucosamine transferase (SPINDLY family)